MPKTGRQKKCKIEEGRISHRGLKEGTCSWCDGTGVRRANFYSNNVEGQACYLCKGSGRQYRCQCGEYVVGSHDVIVGCAIATATLGSDAESALNILRAYRDRMAQYRLGSLFRGWYERIKKPVAAHIRDNQWYKHMVLRLFVQPMLALLRKRESSGVPRLIDMAGMSIYGAMLLWASLVYLLAAQRKQRE